MTEKYEFETKIHKTTDKKRLSNKKTKNYDYGTVNIRSQELAKTHRKNSKNNSQIEIISS